MTALPGWPRGLKADMAAAYVGMSVSGIEAMRRRGEFPAPVPLSPGRLVYLRDDLDAWLDRKAGRAAPRAAGYAMIENVLDKRRRA